MVLLLVILGVTVGEIYLSIKIGQALGLARTIIIMVGIAAIGLFMAKLEAFAIIKKVEREFKAKESMTDSAIELVFVVSGALLLILPGFITDAIGFLFIIPPTRAYFANRVSPAFRHRIEDIVEKKRLEFSSK